MKKNLLTIISTLTLSLFISISMAQIGKGTSLIGGSVYFSSQTSQINSTGGEVKNKNFNVSPSYGIAVKDNFIVGGRSSLWQFQT